MNFNGLKLWIQSRTAKNDRGASLVEYALLVALIAVVCIVAVTTLGGTADKKFDSINTGLNCPSGEVLNEAGDGCEAPAAPDAG